jgi:hypothetical protein
MLSQFPVPDHWNSDWRDDHAMSRQLLNSKAMRDWTVGSHESKQMGIISRRCAICRAAAWTRDLQQTLPFLEKDCKLAAVSQCRLVNAIFEPGIRMASQERLAAASAAATR